MANQWFRLWHDMPNDPKWRTIARVSGQRIGDVLAVYVHLLTSASQNVTRGHTNVTPEDLASALDMSDEAVNSILDAMQGRVIDVDRLSGWDKRQPKREDLGDCSGEKKSAAQRKREQRERDKEEAKQQCHALSHNVTLDTDTDTEQKDTAYAVGDPSNAVSAWNDLADDIGLVKVQKLTAQRKAKLKSRLRDCGGIDGWNAALEKIRGAKWLYDGSARNGWKADFDFILQEKSFTKLMEGSYDAKSSGNQSGKPQNGFAAILHELAEGSA